MEKESPVIYRWKCSECDWLMGKNENITKCNNNLCSLYGKRFKKPSLVLEEIKGTKPPLKRNYPILHNAKIVSNAIPENHPLSGESIYCDSDNCSKILHAWHGDCLIDWVETEKNNYCLECFFIRLNQLIKEGSIVAGKENVKKGYKIESVFDIPEKDMEENI